MKRITPIVVMILMLCGAFTSYAKTRYITTVRVSVDASITPGTDIGDETIEIKTSGQNFEYDSYTVVNKEDSWQASMTPKLNIFLRIKENENRTSKEVNRFKVKKEDVIVEGATFSAVSTNDNKDLLTVTVTLPSLKEYAMEPVNVVLLDTGKVSWDKTENAGSYEVQVVRDGKDVGGRQTVTKNAFDSYYLMTVAGAYQVKVRSVNKTNTSNISGWTTSNSVSIDAAKAAEYKTKYEKALMKKGELTPQWEQDETGWKYRNGNGAYTKSNWQLIGDKWYHFDKKGYMQIGWIKVDGKQYFMGNDGAMRADVVLPDGKKLGTDGALME